ncbi:hypothetical protein LDC_3106 [sediment metagenome]|uniref:Uncharacterized protein n=1 Tax=sediment metagenome TaxID=749907 RepID=D9PNH3_9ZZZZ
MKNYYSDFLTYTIDASQKLEELTNIKINFASVLNVHGKTLEEDPASLAFVDINKSDEIYNFEINQTGFENFARIGQSEANIMNYWFKTSLSPLTLKNLTLTLSGTKSNPIKSLLLKANDDTFWAVKKENKFYFSDLNIPIPENSEITFTFNALLDPLTSQNQRFHLDIENPNDIQLSIDDGFYSLNAIYPVKGPTFTIAGKRL